MKNLYEKLQAIKEANDRRDSFTVRELVSKLQREATLGEVVETPDPVSVFDETAAVA